MTAPPVPRCVYCGRELVAIANPPRQCNEPKSLICNREHSYWHVTGGAS